MRAQTLGLGLGCELSGLVTSLQICYKRLRRTLDACREWRRDSSALMWVMRRESRQPPTTAHLQATVSYIIHIDCISKMYWYSKWAYIQPLLSNILHSFTSHSEARGRLLCFGRVMFWPTRRRPRRRSFAEYGLLETLCGALQRCSRVRL